MQWIKYIQVGEAAIVDEKAREALRKAVYLIGIGEGLKASELLSDLLNQPLNDAAK